MFMVLMIKRNTELTLFFSTISLVSLCTISTSQSFTISSGLTVIMNGSSPGTNGLLFMTNGRFPICKSLYCNRVGGRLVLCGLLGLGSLCCIAGLSLSG